jgi:putative transposase
VPRANRYFIPGYVWHITHRCHKKESLLGFGLDRQVWIKWLFEARKRYNLEVLNYTVTSNHVHLLVYSGADRETIPRSMQLVAGRTAQEYNRRKQRKGAFWEDRYHATAVDTDAHLVRCLVYIDLNMVRAGVVQHPVMWAHGGHRKFSIRPQGTGFLPGNASKIYYPLTESALGAAYQGWTMASSASGNCLARSRTRRTAVEKRARRISESAVSTSSGAIPTIIARG